MQKQLAVQEKWSMYKSPIVAMYWRVSDLYIGIREECLPSGVLVVLCQTGTVQAR